MYTQPIINDYKMVWTKILGRRCLAYTELQVDFYMLQLISVDSRYFTQSLCSWQGQLRIWSCCDSVIVSDNWKGIIGICSLNIPCILCIVYIGRSMNFIQTFSLLNNLTHLSKWKHFVQTRSVSTILLCNELHGKGQNLSHYPA